MPRRPQPKFAETSALPRLRCAVVRGGALCALALALAACTPSVGPEPAAPADESAAARAGNSLPESAPPAGAATAPPAGPRPPAPAIVVPAGALYVCVSGSPSDPRHTPIEYAEKTDALCRKHPEMGPCQYERNLCRRNGGRVYAADGTEVTLAIEADYDRKVRRVQFKAN